ncbi:MAG: glycerophosphodiester phosphodiesterase family protein [Thermoanaerobaculales bacterium]|jgi:glycerophosphoryl diester phosphodiesterase|nr:glycerophosphodiester phosphodiesterase family protein [Thermoanaerobaculales bacterium]
MTAREYKLRLYGHRGAPAHLPENTLPAFERALADGANSLEIDVHPTADGHFVVAHDPDGQRMAGIPEQIKTSTLDQVKKWNVAAGTGRDNLGHHSVPTLSETFEAFPDVPMSIDLKPDDPDAVAPLLEVVARHGAEDRVTLASFSNRVVHRMRQLGYPGRTTLSKSEVAVLRFLPGVLAKRFVRGNAAHIPVVHTGIRLDGRRFIARCRSLGLRVDYWVVDDPEEARRLLDLGATGIMSDDPALIAPVFAGRR